MEKQRNSPAEDQENLSERPVIHETETRVAGGGQSHLFASSEVQGSQEIQDVLEVEGTATEELQKPEQYTNFSAYAFNPHQKPRAITLTDVPDVISVDENFVWIDLSRYTPKNLQRVAECLHLPHTVVHLTLSSWQRPRLDVFDAQFFVTVTLPELDLNASRVHICQVDLFVGPNFLFSAHKKPLPFFKRILTRATHSLDVPHYNSTLMLYTILDELLIYNEEVGEHVQDQIEAMEERALTDTSNTFLSDLLHFKRYVYAINQLIEQHRDVFAAFLRPHFHVVSDQQVEVYYRDLDARLSRLADTFAAAKESTNGIFDIYVSHVSHRTNNVMKILTIVSTTLLPASVILGFFGTNNIQALPILTQPAGFALMVSCILLISALILWTFRHKGWL